MLDHHGLSREEFETVVEDNPRRMLTFAEPA
jgi:predicted metal-dependent phosphotriesterase family hydrolase